MTNDPATAAEPPLGYTSCGSPGRMAALQMLGQRPEGVRSDALRKAIRHADPRVWDEQRMQAVLTPLRTAGLIALERDEFGGHWYFSPGARQVATLRGTWPRKGMDPRTPCRRSTERSAELGTGTALSRMPTPGGVLA